MAPRLIKSVYIACRDNMGTVNGANSFISRLPVLANGKELYQCN